VKRVSIHVDAIREIQQSCYEADDDMQWLVALLCDVGMRSARAAGLHMGTLHLDDAVPYVKIRPYLGRH